jgi:hypothetical protein
MIVVSVRGLAVSAFHSKHPFIQKTRLQKAPVARRPQRIPKVPVADIRTSMLRFSLEASFGSMRGQTSPSEPDKTGYLSS